MAKSEEKEGLKVGRHSFSFIGKAKVGDGTFSGGKKSERSQWFGVNDTFGIETDPGNVVYASINGGYMLDNPNLRAFNKQRAQVTIPWADRFNETMLDNLGDFAFTNIGLEQDEDGKTITKKFLNALDVDDYLKEHLKNDMDIKVSGQVEYSEGKEGRTYVNYRVRTLYLNNSYTNKEGEEVPKKPARASFTQTFLVDDSVLGKDEKKELKENGETTLPLYVPQYIGKRRTASGEYVEWKKISPLVVPIVVRLSDIKGSSDENKLKIIAKYFGMKSGVRAIGLRINVNEGYINNGASDSEEEGVSKELQELIDMGFTTKDEVKSQVTTRGTKTSELVFDTIIAEKDENGDFAIDVHDDLYEEKDLVLPDLDDDDDDDEPFEVDDDKKESTKDDTESEEEKENDELSSIDFDNIFG